MSLHDKCKEEGAEYYDRHREEIIEEGIRNGDSRELWEQYESLFRAKFIEGFAKSLEKAISRMDEFAKEFSVRHDEKATPLNSSKEMKLF